MIKTPLTERMDRWIDSGYPVKRILIHPDDAAQAPRIYRGLRVEILGHKRICKSTA